jgi:hypothetical protein
MDEFGFFFFFFGLTYRVINHFLKLNELFIKTSKPHESKMNLSLKKEKIGGIEYILAC